MWKLISEIEGGSFFLGAIYGAGMLVLLLILQAIGAPQ